MWKRVLYGGGMRRRFMPSSAGTGTLFKGFFIFCGYFPLFSETASAIRHIICSTPFLHSSLVALIFLCYLFDRFPIFTFHILIVRQAE